MSATLLIVGVSLFILFMLVLRILFLRMHLESGRETIRRQEMFIAELRVALADEKTLKGILPICACCKRIRDDNGDWHQLEIFIRQHSEADFSHGLCPSCYKDCLSDGSAEPCPPGGHPPATRRAGT